MSQVRTILFRFGGQRLCAVTAELEDGEMQILSIREISSDLELDTETMLNADERETDAVLEAMRFAFDRPEGKSG